MTNHSVSSGCLENKHGGFTFTVDIVGYQCDCLLLEAKEKANEAYENATEACEKLEKTSPTALGLALNYSVFYYEIMNKPDKACSIAKKVSLEARV